MKILVTGGAGFIGSNVADYFLGQGHKVTTLDNYSRPGVMSNIQWLSQNHNGKLMCYEASIEIKDLAHIVRDAEVVFHFAAQVGVQASIENPHHDFMVNAYGTFRLLETIRKYGKNPLIIFASTNKVYGELKAEKPVSESQPLSFCTPYGCSKGCAEQYMLDYYRVYDMQTVVLRMSCIYGQRQFGTEEQGWLCHFMRNKDNPITIYGDGTQIRDVLHIDDYIRLCDMLIEHKDKVKGQAFNIGGGPKNIISISQAVSAIGNTKISYADWRMSDQQYYVSDITKIKETVKWEPKIDVSEGLERLEQWTSSL